MLSIWHLDKILAKHRTLPGNVLNIVRRLSEDPVGDVRAFVSHLLPSDLRPPTELAYSHAVENARSMATFSRPPPRREPKTLVSGMNNMRIAGPSHSSTRPALVYRKLSTRSSTRIRTRSRVLLLLAMRTASNKSWRRRKVSSGRI